MVVSWIGTLYLCPHENSQCSPSESAPYLLLMLLLWPGAVLFSTIGGIIILSSTLRGHTLRIYVSWSRLCTIPVFILFVLLFYFNGSRQQEYAYEGSDIYAKRDNLTQVKVVSIILIVSRIVQIAIADQFVAHVERLRWTLGWDGLMTALFVTKDVRTEIVADNNIFFDF